MKAMLLMVHRLIHKLWDYVALEKSFLASAQLANRHTELKGIAFIGCPQKETASTIGDPRQIYLVVDGPIEVEFGRPRRPCQSIRIIPQPAMRE